MTRGFSFCTDISSYPPSAACTITLLHRPVKVDLSLDAGFPSLDAIRFRFYSSGSSAGDPFVRRAEIIIFPDARRTPTAWKRRTESEFESKLEKENNMSSTQQKTAARRNIKKAATAAKRNRTIAHLPKSVRSALGKQASSVARKKR